MRGPPSSLEQVLRLAWKQFISFLLIGAFVTYITYSTSISVPQELEGTILATKVTMTSVLIATLAFYYQTFWEETKGLKLEEVPRIVDYHVSNFTLLFGSTLAVFLATGADLLLVFFTDQRAWKAFALGAFFTSLILLFMFLLYFFGRSIAEMQTLKEAAKIPISPTLDKAQLEKSVADFRKQLEDSITQDKENVKKNEQLLEKVKKAQTELSRE